MVIGIYVRSQKVVNLGLVDSKLDPSLNNISFFQYKTLPFRQSNPYFHPYQEFRVEIFISNKFLTGHILVHIRSLFNEEKMPNGKSQELKK